MVTKVKDEENDSIHALVRSPPVAVPTPPSQVSSPFKNNIKISFLAANAKLEFCLDTSGNLSSITVVCKKVHKIRLYGVKWP